VRVEIWSDVVCPWCYIGKRNFESALSEFEHRDSVDVVWRSFELDPSAPPVREGDYASRLAAKYGVVPAEARARLARMTSAAADVGLAFHFDLAKPGNTFDAHRLIHLGAAHGLQDAVKERFLKATFTDGEPIGDRDVLLRLAIDSGLDQADASAVLDGDTYASDVRDDEREATELGITAVPFFVIDRTYGIPGAQPPRALGKALRHAWDENHAPKLAITADSEDAAPGCEGDACAV
jgi:predicted DsbA family dithiol-disulfide isomerase